jgi:tetratricopeptide (TPR) repeat protein
MEKSAMRPASKAPVGTAAAPKNPSFDFDAYGTAHIPEDRDQDVVRTPYGRAIVIRTRRGGGDVASRSRKVVMREMELVDWTKLAESSMHSNDRSGRPQRPAVLYSPTDYPSVDPQVNDEVTCAFGRGTVVEIRRRPAVQGDVVVVLISSWRLAGRSRVRCYLSQSAVRVVRHKRLYEKTVCEKVEHGQDLKGRANELFASKDYREALTLYAQAIDSVRYVQHKTDSSNETRADLIVLLVTCYNNAGMCCSQLNEPDLWDAAARYSGSAIILIDALEEKKGLKIHSVLLREGHTDVKLFGEWKAKALLLKARALMERRNSDTDEAQDLLKQAIGVIRSYPDGGGGASSPTLASMEREARRLHARCKEQRKKEREREKKRALKMFAEPSFEEEKKEKSSPETSPPRSPVPSDAGCTTHSCSGGPNNDAFESRTKRVSFSEHVSERLYQPEERHKEGASTKKKNRGALPLRLWNHPMNKFYTGMGVAAGALLVLVSVHRILRLKQ